MGHATFFDSEVAGGAKDVWGECLLGKVINNDVRKEDRREKEEVNIDEVSCLVFEKGALD